jgi:hypothetical protein
MTPRVTLLHRSPLTITVMLAIMATAVAVAIGGCGSGAQAGHRAGARTGQAAGARAGGNASDAAVHASYPVLDNTNPNDITVTDAAQARHVRGPVWGVSDTTVDIYSAREASVNVLGLRVWVAMSAEGGICVLALMYQPQSSRPQGPAADCGQAGALNRGAVMEQLGPHGSTILSGVVPRGVASVTVQLMDGRTRTAPVSEDVYAAEYQALVRRVQFTVGGRREQINLPRSI